MNGEASWSVGWYIGVGVTIIVGFIVLLAILLTVVAINDARKGDGGVVGFAVGTWIVALLAGGGLFWAMYPPFDAEYHQWRDVTGEVTDVDKRLKATSGSMEERYVVTIDGVGSRSCDDTRCSQVNVGDTLTLTCKREWQYTGTDGYACNFIERRAAA